MVGEIVGGGLAGGKPLLFYGGGYNRIAHAPPSQDGARSFTLEESYDHFAVF